MKTIYVVDDNEGILDVIDIILQGEGFDVKQVTDPELIINLNTPFPDLILLDVWMSGVDGRDICRQLKQQAHTKHIPIVLISANKDLQEIAAAASADAYLSKPFEMEDLIAVVNRFVGT